MFEAQAIALEIEKIIPNRPMTHDLFKSFAAGFDYTIEQVMITDLKEGVYYATIHCKSQQGEASIDARPSDAIAIAIRFACPIFCQEKVMAEGGVEHFDVETGTSQSSRSTSRPEVEQKSKSSLKDYSLSKLNSLLEKALLSEEYEKAARIRDEINKRN